jgi:hypothetical protein
MIAFTDSPSSRREGSTLIRRLIYIAFFLEVGLLLIVVPWSEFWDSNYFAELWPALRLVVTNNFVRGAVSGLGVVNLVAAFAELAWVFTARSRSVVSLRDGGPPV